MKLADDLQVDNCCNRPSKYLVTLILLLDTFNFMTKEFTKRETKKNENLTRFTTLLEFLEILSLGLFEVFFWNRILLII